VLASFVFLSEFIQVSSLGFYNPYIQFTLFLLKLYMEVSRTLKTKIEQKTAVVGIMGVGYVGSNLGWAVSSAGYNVVGFDIDKHKIYTINSAGKKNFIATDDFSKLGTCDVVFVCVPTPVDKSKKPNLTPFVRAIKSIKEYLKKGQLIIVESSVAPGTVRGIALPVLQTSGMTAENDFFLAFSPERVDPGNRKYEFCDIPKIVAGMGNTSKDLTASLYGKFVNKVVPVSSIETAEFTKLFENTFRLVNISLVNQVQEYADAIGIDMNEVVEAAATKPFGFLPHYPGPGVGGHCIPVDPYYLVDDAKKHNISLSIIEDAGRINSNRPKKVAGKAQRILEETNGVKKHHTVLIVGVTYKPDVADVRESASLEIWEMLREKGYTVHYHDPYISAINGVSSIELSDDTVKNFDLIIISTDHKNIDYDGLLQAKIPILDTRNVYNGNATTNVFRL
jgi:UDP-N-acetyl-D-glucosamine dehydrogenase